MSHKITALMLAVVSAAFLIFGGLYLRKSGYFEPYPDAEYLTAEEEAERPFYEQLSRREQAAYTALYRGICGKKTEIALPFEIDGETYSKLYCILEKQEGALFYIDSSYYTAQKIKYASIMMREESGDSVAEKEKALAEIADKIVSKLPAYGGDFEKALYIHDYLVANCKYVTKNETGYSSTVYGCLVEGVANCEGYAKTFGYLARKAGIEAVLVTGVTYDGDNHAWNQVKINGSWYNLDVTWDDLDNSADKRHTYFLCSDMDFAKTHSADNTAGATFTCGSSDENYFVKTDLFVKNMDDADRILRREIALGTKMIEMRFADSAVYSEFTNEYLEKKRLFDIITEHSSPILGGKVTVNMKENEKENCLAIYIE